MAQIYICPSCGCPDLMYEAGIIITEAKEKKAGCPNCNWSGSLADAAGILTTEHVYDTKAVLNLLLYTTMKHAAGPIAQALIFVGLLEQGDEVGLNAVMRAAIEGLVKETFTAAAAHAKAKKMSPLKATPFCPVCMGTGVLEEEHHIGTCPRCNGAGAAQKRDTGCGMCTRDLQDGVLLKPCLDCQKQHGLKPEDAA